MELLKKIFVLTYCLLSSLSIVLAQELPFYEVDYGWETSYSDFSTAGGTQLWNPPLGSGNSISIKNYLIASESVKGYADSLSGEGIPIGFDFPFAGDTFDIFGVSSKGYIVLSKKEVGLTIYADTLQNLSDDTVFTKKNSYLLSGLILGKNFNNVRSYSIQYKNYGFVGKRNLTISFNPSIRIAQATGSSTLNPSFLLTLYEDGTYKVRYGSTYVVFSGSTQFSTLAFLSQRYGNNLNVYFWSDTSNKNTTYNNLNIDFQDLEKFGLVTQDFQPKIEDGKVYSLIFTPKPFPLSLVCPFIWDQQARQGELTGYYDNDHSLLQDDTISTTSTLWWYAPQYEPIRYDAYLGIDTLSMALIGEGITGDSVNPRNSFQKVPLARLALDSLAPSTQYYLKIVSKSATDSLVSYTSFYTDSIEEAYNYCTNMGISPFFTGPLGEIHFNEMLFINPSGQWDQHLVSDTGTWTTTLARGAAYTLSVKAMPGFAVTLFNLKAYIDFNHNGVFEPGEGFFAPQILSENRFTDISIPIPEDAYIGKTRMRFVLPFTTTNEATISPCSVSEYLDFTVTIVQPDSCKGLTYTLAAPPPCFNSQNGSLSLFPTGGVSPYKIQWNTGNPADTLATLSGLEVNAMHRATITDANGCNLRTAMAVVTQSSPVLLDTSQLNNLKLVLKGETAPYEVEINGINLEAPVLLTRIADTLALNNLSDGIYTVKVSDARACTYDLGEVKLLHTGILASREAKELVLYPNPAEGVTSVQGLKHFTAKIYGSSGNLVKLVYDNGTRQIALQGLEPGLYLLKIVKENALYRQKLIVK